MLHFDQSGMKDGLHWSAKPAYKSGLGTFSTFSNLNA